MKKFLNNFTYIFKFGSILIIFLAIIRFPEIAKAGAKSGIIIAYEIILPSLFPMLCACLMINKSNLIDEIPIFKKKNYLKNYFYVVIISNLGGYPIGAKVLNEQFKNKQISKKDANLLLYCSVNPGPAFTVLVVGCGILNSLKAGIVIYISQILSSLVIFCLIYKFLEKNYNEINKKKLNFSDIFVDSVSDASLSILNISGYIIFSSSILEIINSADINLSFINYFFEITNAILSTKNIYILSIILSFASFSILFQIISIAKAFKPNFIKIVAFKILNCILTVILIIIILKIFPIKFETMSNLYGKVLTNNSNKLVFTLIFISTFISFLVSITNEKLCGKISKDIF